jgi:hypothetical protein
MHSFFVFLVNLPWLGAAVFALASVLGALACYVALRRLAGTEISVDSPVFSGAIIARLGTLHALIVALIFAQEMADYIEVSKVVTREATTIGEVYKDLLVFDQQDPQATMEIAGLISDYIVAVIGDVRETSTTTELRQRVAADFDTIERKLRELQPVNEYQRSLRKQVLSDWNTVAGYQEQIKVAAAHPVPDFFWILAVSGFFAVVIPAYVYSPKLSNMITLCTYAAFNGVVLFMILAIDNPFIGPGAIKSVALNEVLAAISGAGN